MADLSDIAASQSIKIAGANPSTGIESNYANVDSNGNLLTKDFSDGLTGSAVPSNASQVGGINAAGNLQALVLRSTVPAYTEAGIVTRPIPYQVVTYSATSTFNVSTNATDIFTITGSATKTIKILKIGISATISTTSIVDLTVLRRSTANSAGTSTTLTNVPLDSTNAAATATIRSYTTNPTLGTLVGNIKNVKFLISATSPGGAVSAQPQLIFDFNGPYSGQALTVRGISEVVAINMNSTSMNGNSICIWVEWTEE